MSDHILGLRKAKGVGWTTGVVHARVRHGQAALELRGTHHHLTLRDALESLPTRERLNGHGGVVSDLLGATAGPDARDQILRDFLDDPGSVLISLWLGSQISRVEWARRARVNVSTLRRVLNGTQRPSFDTARRMLEALQ